MTRSLAAPVAALLLLGPLVCAGLGAAPARAGDAAAGKQVAGQCRTCHGLDGIAKMPQAPHIAGENEIYLLSQLKAFRSGARTHEIMSVIAAGLSDEEMADVAAWYASIKITAELPN